MTARAEVLAAVLAEHQATLLESGCLCGWRSTTVVRLMSEHRTHVVAALDAALTAQEGDREEAPRTVGSKTGKAGVSDAVTLAAEPGRSVAEPADRVMHPGTPSEPSAEAGDAGDDLFPEDGCPQGHNPASNPGCQYAPFPGLSLVVRLDVIQAEWERGEQADGRADLADRIAAVEAVHARDHWCDLDGRATWFQNTGDPRDSECPTRAALGDPDATLAEVKAAAWDEGLEAGTAWTLGNPTTAAPPNPYRIERGAS